MCVFFKVRNIMLKGLVKFKLSTFRLIPQSHFNRVHQILVDFYYSGTENLSSVPHNRSIRISVFNRFSRKEN